MQRSAAPEGMADNPENRQGDTREGNRVESAWRRMGNGRSIWVSPEPSPEEVEMLARRFPEVAELPEDEVREETEGWAALAVVARSLGRRVAAEAVIREFRLRAGVKGGVVGYNLEMGHFIFRFEETEERERVLGRPWVVAGQALAVEPWRPRFNPSEGAIRSALVWVRLPRLPAELWREASIRSILRLAGELVAIDEYTAERRRLGFARACIRIDLGRPLRPGVLIEGPEGHQWQRFVFENLGGVCFRCGRFHSPAACPSGGGEGGPSAGLTHENMVAGGEEALGPWLVAVRQWLPGPEAVDGLGKKGGAREGRVNQGRFGKELGNSNRVNPPERSDGGWIKADKIARRRSAPRSTAGLEPGEGVEIRADQGLGLGLNAGSGARVDRAANRFGLLAAGYEEGGSSCGAGSNGPRAGPVEEMGAGAGKPKRARPSDFDAGQASERPSGRGKGAKGKGKGLLSLNKAKDKGPVGSVAKMDASAIPGEPGIFFFSAETLEGGSMAENAEQGMVVETAGNSIHSVPGSGRQGSDCDVALTHPEHGASRAAESALDHEVAVDRLRRAIQETDGTRETAVSMDTGTEGGTLLEGGSDEDRLHHQPAQ